MQKGVDYIGITVSFVCHDGTGNYLMNKRSVNCRDEHGTWDFGGGGLEIGEKIEDCLKKIEYYLDKDSPCSWQRRIHIQGRANNIAYNKLTFQIRCHELMVLFQHRNRLMQMI